MRDTHEIPRREFIIAGGVAALASTCSLGANSDSSEATQRITLAQILVTRKVEQNAGRMIEAIEQAEHDKAGWIIFPEAALSGYYGGFQQSEVEAAFDQIRARCKQANVIGLIGTGWNEGAQKPHNEIRIVDRSGELIGQYAKVCLTYGDAKDFAVGEFPLVHQVGGLTIGTLICNDLWVTPGFTDGPNPHLSLKQARAGAQVIFHAVSSGGDPKYRAYHESNQQLRAAEANCPFVTVNSAVESGEVNCTSGVILASGEYGATLSRRGEEVKTVEFTPRQAQ